MLHLVTPSGAHGQDPPKRRRGVKPASLYLTADEARFTRAALRNTSRAYGGPDALAVVMGVPVTTLYQASSVRRSLSGTFAIRLAKAAGTTVEAVLTGQLTMTGRCKACGSSMTDRRAAGGAP